jgi:hypothetical protein
MNEEAQSRQKEESRGESCCPVCSLMKSVCDARSRHSDFFNHLHNAKIELLKAARSLLNEQIESSEKRKSEEGRPKEAKKIKIE